MPPFFLLLPMSPPSRFSSWRSRWQALGLAALLLAGLGWASPALAAAATANPVKPAPVASRAAQAWVVGPDGQPFTLQQALAQARDGDTIELLPGEYSAPNLLLQQRRLTLRGLAAGAQRPVLRGVPLEGGAGRPPGSASRALLTQRGGQLRVENIEFRGARSAEGAGAGIRQEGGTLQVVGSAFYDNEHGILALADDDAVIEIEDTQFGLAPRVPGSLPHLLNVGRIARLSVQGSRFQQGYEGHMIKSRARESFIGYNFLHDGNTGATSYQIELPLGGLATVIGNVIGQSPEARNRVMLAYGAEGSAWPRNALYVAHNTFINGLALPAWFLRVWAENLPPDTKVLGVNNLLVGGGVFELGVRAPFKHFGGNRHARRGMLADAATYAFELPPDSVWRGSGINPRDVQGVDLAPQAEFSWPMGRQPLPAGRSIWSPGAFQK
jgi:hypothetical protein